MSDKSEAVFTAPCEREARVSADRQRITHRAGPWSITYTPAELLRWIGFYERMLGKRPTPNYRADVEVLHKARDLLASDRGQP